MALNQAQLMATPGGAGSVTNYPGAIKQGTGLTISSDGTTSLNAATTSTLGGVIVGNGLQITQSGVLSIGTVGVSSVTGGTGIQTTGTTDVVVALRPATSGTIGGVKVAAAATSGLNLAGDGSLSVAQQTGNFLPLTGGKISAAGTPDTQYPGTLLIQSPASGGEGTNSRAPLLLLKGPGDFPSGTGPNGTFLFACYDPEDDVGVSIRWYDPEPLTPLTADTSISNQLAVTQDNLWIWSGRQLRFNADVSTTSVLFQYYQYGSINKGGRTVAYINSSGQFVANPGSSFFAPPVALGGGSLAQINSLTPQAFQYTIVPGDGEGLVTGNPYPSETVYGFTKSDIEANLPAALEEYELDGNTEYGINSNTILTYAIGAIQELSEALDTTQAQLDALQQSFNDYVSTHP